MQVTAAAVFRVCQTLRRCRRPRWARALRGSPAAIAGGWRPPTLAHAPPILPPPAACLQIFIKVCVMG